MSRFLKLIYNEQLKLYINKTTWIMYIILATLIIGGAVIVSVFDDDLSKPTGDDWREELQEENDSLLREIEEAGENEGFVATINGDFIAENDYYLENDIKPESYGAWQYVHENQGLLSLVSLLTIIVAGGVVANEFRWGTIKLLLIRPISRVTILLSKYLSVIIFAIITSLFLYVFSFIVGALFFGIEGTNPHILLHKNNGFEYVSIIGDLLSTYGYRLINLIMMATFAFMISTVFRSSALAIGLAIFLMMAGNQIVFAFAEYPWAKYILFANTDLQQYANGNVLIEGMTLGFSISVLIGYYAIFIGLSWLIFIKRDVASQ
ncbi:ABC transporter permease [Virgibacillus sp. MSJ-26]|uniref:ABC transporter permease n=1 Tax=Virgibacillus sp. MSJ-26 TaxID=2841522 RepID=UPI001C126A7B|nr:ABC transporter permease [Virgibacillus sp. MSJ-26]MBU5467531.1 ABC transporter permease [Virgibacillus sp. MSJ-26]